MLMLLWNGLVSSVLLRSLEQRLWTQIWIWAAFMAVEVFHLPDSSHSDQFIASTNVFFHYASDYW